MDLTKCFGSLASLSIVLAYTFKNPNGFLTSYDVYIQKLDEKIRVRITSLPFLANKITSGGTDMQILAKKKTSCNAHLLILTKNIASCGIGLPILAKEITSGGTDMQILAKDCIPEE